MTGKIKAIGFIQLVDKRDANTLLPIIQHVVAPGSTVWLHEWAACVSENCIISRTCVRL